MELEQLYTEDNVLLREQRAKVRKTEQLYQSRLSQFAGTVTQEKSQMLAQRRKQLSQLEDRIQEIRDQQLTPSEKRQVAKLERQLSMWEDNYLNLVKQLYQARVTEQSSRRQGAITILENPTVGVLAKDKKGRTLLVQVMLGLPFSLGFAIAVLVSLEYLGASLRLVPKIEKSLGVSVMAIIPPVSDHLGQIWEAYKREETTPQGYISLLLNEPTQETMAPTEVPASEGLWEAKT